ncbi:hypothetical protein RCH20_000482 [Psychrobacter sp. PL15]|uniref:hypothetical protein n=1 Tax=unclassified Psychrobacter TaxID=196806 RepID=UPI001AE0EE2A|nr:hypothetical protein [Psychrobacter sp. PL15]MEC5209433.1 hypothetical protein [Psychrobacter sp. PL15]
MTQDTIQAVSLRIDTAIKQSSHLRLLLYGSLAGALLLLAWLASLFLWQYILLLIISIVIAGYLALSRPILLHLSQPPLHQRIDRNWQLLMRTKRSDELWQAGLATVHRYDSLINFKFIVVEPRQRTLSVTIFRDQVNTEQWRELQVLANVFPTKTT